MTSAPPNRDPPAPTAWLRFRIPELPAPAQVRCLPREASARTFHRLTGPGGSVIAMTAPPGSERNEAYVVLSAALRARGIVVPRVRAWDPGRGLFALTDLGDQPLVDLGAAGDPLGIDLLVAWQARTGTLARQRGPYSRARFEFEFGLFQEHFCRLLVGTTPPPRTDTVRERLIGTLTAQPTVLVHRDWHGRNLLLLPGARPDGPEAAERRVGIVDFQDAVRGPVLYDLASWIHDVYRPVPADGGSALLQRWLAGARAARVPVPEAPERDLRRTALQRLLKVLGQFARLARTRPELSHGALVPSVRTRAASLARQDPDPDVRALGTWLGTVPLPPAPP